MEIVAGDALKRALEEVPGWSVTGGGLTRVFRFGSFVEAIAFVNRAADIAEELGHHPDLDIRYDNVRAFLVTHDAGGITNKDFAVASRLSQLLQLE